MSLRALAYLLFTLALSGVFAGIVLHYYSRNRRDRVEAPKYRMLHDDDPGPAGDPPPPERR